MFFRLKLEDGQPRLMVHKSHVSKWFSLTSTESSFMLLLDSARKRYLKNSTHFPFTIFHFQSTDPPKLSNSSLTDTICWPVMEGGQSCQSGTFFFHSDFCIKAAAEEKCLFKIQTYTYLVSLEDSIHSEHLPRQQIDAEGNRSLCCMGEGSCIKCELLTVFAVPLQQLICQLC